MKSAEILEQRRYNVLNKLRANLEKFEKAREELQETMAEFNYAFPGVNLQFSEYRIWPNIVCSV